MQRRDTHMRAGYAHAAPPVGHSAQAATFHQQAQAHQAAFLHGHQQQHGHHHAPPPHHGHQAHHLPAAPGGAERSRYLTNTTFASLPLAPATQRALAEVLRFSHLTEVQEATLPAVSWGAECTGRRHCRRAREEEGSLGAAGRHACADAGHHACADAPCCRCSAICCRCSTAAT